MNPSACAGRAAAIISSRRRLGPAVEDVVGDRAVQQRGVLRHHADLAAQALLARLGDVLAVDQDAAAFDVVEAQQQIDERRLAGAGAADEPDLFARRDAQREAFDHAARLCRSGTSRRRSESRRAAPPSVGASGASSTRARLREGAHALLHLADAVEDADRRPHHPAGHGDHAHAERRSPRAMSPSVSAPRLHSQTESAPTTTISDAVAARRRTGSAR